MTIPGYPQLPGFFFIPPGTNSSPEATVKILYFKVVINYIFEDS